MSYLIQINDKFNGFSFNFIYILIAISIIAGILIIISKNPIVSVLHLILLFSTIACYLIFVGISFIGISYLLVYVGAVSILFLFILMLINIRVSELISATNNNIPLALITLFAFYIPISEVLPDNNNNKAYNILSFITNETQQVSFVSSNNWDGVIVDVTDIISIGNIMYTSYSMWLVLTSIILLLAMVGSIIITIKQKY